jgi:hypothetical protein
MLRELHQLLGELHDGLNALELHGGVRLSNVDMTLPLELRAVFRDGGCVLLADVPRQRAVDGWLASPSKLVIGWSADGHRYRGESDAEEQAPPPAERAP